MREKPTLLLLHGGPGFDHSHLKPAFSALSDVAQLVYVPAEKAASQSSRAGLVPILEKADMS